MTACIVEGKIIGQIAIYQRLLDLSRAGRIGRLRVDADIVRIETTPGRWRILDAVDVRRLLEREAKRK